ncbi:MAG: hypothetical protein ACPK7O_01635 [Methanobacterium sp.]
MNKINYLFLCVIALITLAGSSTSYGQQDNLSDALNINSIKLSDMESLGSTEYGNVIKSGPYGNPYGTQKIAFIVGVHPLEENSHRAITASLLSLNKSLNSSYYIYSIHVSKDRDSYNNGRMNGQLLAKNFVVPDIQKNYFNLVIDVHSNRGGNFKNEIFVFVPQNEPESIKDANNIIAQIPWLVYYVPPSEEGPKSPAYVTIPLIESGNPALIYETYRYEPFDVTVKRAVDFIKGVDKLKLS